MKLVLAVLTAALSLSAAEIGGNWGALLDTQLPNGRVYNAFVYIGLTQDGSSIKGSIGESETKAWPITDGTLQDGKLLFTAHPSDVQAVKFDLTLSGDHLIGEAVADRNGTAVKMKVNAIRNGPVYWYIHGRSLLESSPQPGTPSFHDAQTAFETAVRLDPKLAIAYVELGKLYLDGARAADAVPVLEKAVALWKDYRPAYMHLATAYRRTNQPERAAATLAQLKDVIAKQQQPAGGNPAQAEKHEDSAPKAQTP